jgi:hypothetical protein
MGIVYDMKQLIGRVGKPKELANTSRFEPRVRLVLTGQNVVNGGMIKKLMYLKP